MSEELSGNALVQACAEKVSEQDIWDELETFLDDHHSDYNLSFGLEYSSVVDWCADITPRRNHPQACEYGKVWIKQHAIRHVAVAQVVKIAREWIESHPCASQ